MHNSLPNELHWTKYLEANCDRLQRPLLEEVFVRCEDFIDFLSPFLSLKQIKPTLFIVKEDENKAGHKNGKIYIFEGLLKPFKISDENAAIHSGQNVTSVYLLYVIAHEFFHYSRQHNKIKENLVVNIINL